MVYGIAKRQPNISMPSRALRRLQSALSRTRCSPEEFVIRHQSAVAWYSARSIRRWLAGEPIPKAVAIALDAFHVNLHDGGFK